jgi:hypothetical protein
MSPAKRADALMGKGEHVSYSGLVLNDIRRLWHRVLYRGLTGSLECMLGCWNRGFSASRYEMYGINESKKRV